MSDSFIYLGLGFFLLIALGILNMQLYFLVFSVILFIGIIYLFQKINEAINEEVRNR